jgi:hypothetical protein
MTTQITPHFTKECLEFSETANEHHIDNSIPDSLYPKAQRLCQEMEDVRTLLSEYYKEDTPIFTNSGYRCPEVNTLTHGQPTSQHMALEAMDFHTSHPPIDDWNIIKASKLPYDQLILEHDSAGHIWTHYSVSRPNQNARHMAFTLEKK